MSRNFILCHSSMLLAGIQQLCSVKAAASPIKALGDDDNQFLFARQILNIVNSFYSQINTEISTG